MSDIFNADEIAADQLPPDAEAPPPAPPPPSDERPRDDQGRFAPKQDDAPPAPEGEQRDERGNLVPQGALHAEREKRKTAEQQAREYKGQLDAIAAMRAKVTAPPQPPGDAPPADADDKAQVAYLRQRLEQIEGTQQQQQQRQQADNLDQVERQHLSAALTQSEAEYRASKPDYDAAINHVVQARAQELALYGLNQVQVQQTLQQEVLDITRAAIDQGRSPAEVAYQLATLRGYRAQSGQEQQQQQPAPQNDAQRQLAAIAEARRGSRSLGQASGSAPAKELNAATIAAMSDDEFQTLYSTPEGKRMIDAL